MMSEANKGAVMELIAVVSIVSVLAWFMLGLGRIPPADAPSDHDGGSRDENA